MNRQEIIKRSALVAKLLYNPCVDPDKFASTAINAALNIVMQKTDDLGKRNWFLSEVLSNEDAPGGNSTKNPRNPTDTQVDAALLALPNSGTARARVLEEIRWCSADSRHGATDEELQTSLKMNPNTERPRRKELEEGGWIRDSGKRRRNKSGAKAIVWASVNDT